MLILCISLPEEHFLLSGSCRHCVGRHRRPVLWALLCLSQCQQRCTHSWGTRCEHKLPKAAAWRALWCLPQGPLLLSLPWSVCLWGSSEQRCCCMTWMGIIWGILLCCLFPCIRIREVLYLSLCSTLKILFALSKSKHSGSVYSEQCGALWYFRL